LGFEDADLVLQLQDGCFALEDLRIAQLEQLLEIRLISRRWRVGHKRH